jgi:hypothetical protein
LGGHTEIPVRSRGAPRNFRYKECPEFLRYILYM